MKLEVCVVCHKAKLSDRQWTMIPIRAGDEIVGCLCPQHLQEKQREMRLEAEHARQNSRGIVPLNRSQYQTD